MFHSIRDQYDIITAEQGFQTDFQAMLDWLSFCNMKPCDSEYFGEEINSILVNRWVNYRDSLFNSQGINRLYLEQCARRMCEPDELGEFEDNLESTSDGHLMALGRIFYSQPKAVEDPDSISIRWSIDDVKHICPKVTDQQARSVLQSLKRNHNAEIGINWDVIDSAIESVLPEVLENSDDSESYVDEKFANDIIDGRPQLFDAIEIHDVTEQVRFFSVCLHLVAGGIDCVGEFSTQELAVSYAQELSQQYHWPINNFSKPVNEKVIDIDPEILRQLRGFQPADFIVVDWNLVNEMNIHADCTGLLACVFNDNYSGIEDAALSGAVYFASQEITTRAELEGALLGNELTQSAAGTETTLYFVRR